jgi:hypothetical protein
LAGKTGGRMAANFWQKRQKTGRKNMLWKHGSLHEILPLWTITAIDFPKIYCQDKPCLCLFYHS